MEARGFNVDNLALGEGNLCLWYAIRTCKNFWDFADSKSSLNPKNSYKYKSHTAITSIVIRVANQLRNQHNFLIPSLRGVANAEAIQSKNTNRISPDSWCRRTIILFGLPRLDFVKSRNDGENSGLFRR